jgi:hypothetical protein
MDVREKERGESLGKGEIGIIHNVKLRICKISKIFVGLKHRAQGDGEQLGFPVSRVDHDAVIGAREGKKLKERIAEDLVTAAVEVGSSRTVCEECVTGEQDARFTVRADIKAG